MLWALLQVFNVTRMGDVIHALSIWALQDFWHRPFLASNTCLTHSWATYRAPCHFCTLTHSCSSISPALQFSALNPKHLLAPFYTASGHASLFKLPSKGQLLPDEAQQVHGEGVHGGGGAYSQSQHPFLFIQTCHHISPTLAQTCGTIHTI